MTQIVLETEVRAKDEDVKTLRNENTIPAIVYGKTQEPISLKIDNSKLLRAYRTAWESTIINLKVGKEDIEVLIHKIDRNPVTGDFLHMDFYALTRGEKLTTRIALHFIWDAPAEKEGAIINEAVKDIEVKCLPRNLVDHFDIDLSVLKEIGDTVTLADIGLDIEKYEIDMPIETPLVLAAQPAKVEVEETIVTEGEEGEADGESSEWVESENSSEKE